MSFRFSKQEYLQCYKSLFTSSRSLRKQVLIDRFATDGRKCTLDLHGLPFYNPNLSGRQPDLIEMGQLFHQFDTLAFQIDPLPYMHRAR